MTDSGFIRVDETLMRDVVAGLLAKELTEAKREELITAAIAHLLTPKQADRFTYGRQTSPLEDVLQTVTREIASKLVREQLEADPTFASRIREVTAAAVEKAFVQKDALIDSFARAIAHAVRNPDKAAG